MEEKLIDLGMIHKLRYRFFSYLKKDKNKISVYLKRIQRCEQKEKHVT